MVVHLHPSAVFGASTLTKYLACGATSCCMKPNLTCTGVASCCLWMKRPVASPDCIIDQYEANALCNMLCKMLAVIVTHASA